MEEDEEVPDLITLDEHLSTEVDRKLRGIGERNDILENSPKKVPITILTGLQNVRSALTNRVPRLRQNNTPKLHSQ